MRAEPLEAPPADNSALRKPLRAAAPLATISAIAIVWPYFQKKPPARGHRFLFRRHTGGGKLFIILSSNHSSILLIRDFSVRFGRRAPAAIGSSSDGTRAAAKLFICVIGCLIGLKAVRLPPAALPA